MFERYTEKARRVIFYSREFASGLGDSAIEPRHILLGIIREDEELFRRLGKLNFQQIDAIRDRIRTATRPRGNTSTEMPISFESKRVLEYAADESKQLKHKFIGTEHLLLGLLRGKTIAAGILIEHEFELSRLRDELRKGSGPVFNSSNAVSCRVDISNGGSIAEMRKLAAEARDLAAAIVNKAARIESICDKLENSSDSPGDED